MERKKRIEEFYFLQNDEMGYPFKKKETRHSL